MAFSGFLRLLITAKDLAALSTIEACFRKYVYNGQLPVPLRCLLKITSNSQNCTLAIVPTLNLNLQVGSGPTGICTLLLLCQLPPHNDFNQTHSLTCPFSVQVRYRKSIAMYSTCLFFRNIACFSNHSHIDSIQAFRPIAVLYIDLQ